MDDALEVHSRFADVRGASLTADQVVRRGAEELARLVVRIACLDTKGRARRLPTDLRAALAAS